ncbi:hypothetical protein EYC82_07155 [Halieaceae bacterium IMCC11814]|jgi:hypothetical protein|uniref:Uncharacterized protein n=2 Tax=Candidatus Marimicrobium litorale TaxID=2518991 RepID=A0ABT3T5P5_9GAMM|nr:hypothetical protein [Candidatus Marimicrobium litorale]
MLAAQVYRGQVAVMGKVLEAYADKTKDSEASFFDFVMSVSPMPARQMDRLLELPAGATAWLLDWSGVSSHQADTGDTSRPLYPPTISPAAERAFFIHWRTHQCPNAPIDYYKL